MLSAKICERLAVVFVVCWALSYS